MITAEFYLFYPNYAKTWPDDTVTFASTTAFTDVSTGDVFFVNISLTTTGTLVGQVLSTISISDQIYNSATGFTTTVIGTFVPSLILTSITVLIITQFVAFYPNNQTFGSISTFIVSIFGIFNIGDVAYSSQSAELFALSAICNPLTTTLPSVTGFQDLILASDYPQSINLSSSTGFLDTIIENAIPGTVNLISTTELTNNSQATIVPNIQTLSSISSCQNLSTAVVFINQIFNTHSSYLLSSQQSVDLIINGISLFIVGIPELNKTFRDQKAVFHMVVQYSLGEVWDMTTPERKAVDFKAPGPEDWNQISSELQAVIKDLLAAPWCNLILENSWVNSPGYATLSYKKVGNQINLRGVITNGQAQNGTIISILPLGLRPVTPLTLTVNVPGGGTQVNGMTVLISVNGTIKCYSWGSAANIDFSNVRFFTDQ